MPSPSSLYGRPNLLRVLWHDIQKAPTAWRAFSENAREGMYGQIPKDLRAALETADLTITEQEILLCVAQVLNKTENGLSFGDAEEIRPAASLARVCERYAAWFARRKRALAGTLVDASGLRLPETAWRNILTLLAGAAGLLPQGRGMRVSGAARGSAYVLTVQTSGIRSVPAEALTDRIEELFGIAPTPWTGTARCLYAFRQIVPATGGTLRSPLIATWPLTS